MNADPKKPRIGDDSIIRRSVILLLLVAPAYLFNFGFLVVSQRLLGVRDFGVFYTGLSIINILSGPAIILNLFYSRRITINLSLYGKGAAVSEYKRYVRHVLTWGSLLGLITAFGLWLFGYYLDVESIFLILIICLTSYCIYLAETARSALQGLKRFVALGIQTLSWMAIRFILGIMGLLIFGYVWVGISGVLLASVIMFFAGFFYITRGTGRINPGVVHDSFELKQILSFSTSYGFFILLMYLDVIVAYFALSRTDLGLYSAACVIGKSVILITNPIVQVYFPVIVEQNVKNGIEKVTVIKTLGITFAISCSVLFIVSMIPNFIGTQIFGLKNFLPSLLIAITTSAIPLSMLRIFILLQLTKGLDKHAFILLPICVLQFIVLVIYKDNIVTFAWAFTISCFVVMLFYGILCNSREKVHGLKREIIGTDLRQAQ